MTRQLTEMAKPFPKQFMGKDDRGNDAVDHTVVTQRLLQIIGPYTLEVKEVLRSQVDGMTTKSGKAYSGGHFVTGVILRLTVTIDGKEVSVEEVGGCENAAMKDGDGERMKHAMSDAIKRCSMRLGLGLHMWAQENFFLYDRLLNLGESPSVGEPQAGDVPSEASSVSPQSVDGEAQEDAVPGPAAPTEKHAWLDSLRKAYSDEAILQTVNAIRSERPKAADRVPLDSIEEVGAARKATQEEIHRRLAEADWSAPKQESLA